MLTPQKTANVSDRSRCDSPSDLTDEELGACRACDPASQARRQQNERLIVREVMNGSCMS